MCVSVHVCACSLRSSDPFLPVTNFKSILLAEIGRGAENAWVNECGWYVHHVYT